MGDLYAKLAPVYEAMYQTFIDYKEQYQFYGGLLKLYQKRQVLEIGSGTGSLAKYFIEHDYDFLGLDYSKEMIQIAQMKNPKGRFLQGDMRDFTLEDATESALITGRTISYLTRNEEVLDTFSTIHKNLKSGGILCFDFIDATKFIPAIGNGKTLTHRASHQNIHYLRTSNWTINLENGMKFQWDSTYFQETEEGLVALGTDNSLVRAFMLNEIEVFLALSGFELKEVIEKPAYAFPTIVVLAEKKGTV